MIAVNNTENQAKSSKLALNLLASLSSSLNHGPSSMFAELLSSTQTPSTPTPKPQTNSQQADSMPTSPHQSSTNSTGNSDGSNDGNNDPAPAKTSDPSGHVKIVRVSNRNRDGSTTPKTPSAKSNSIADSNNPPPANNATPDTTSDPNNLSPAQTAQAASNTQQGPADPQDNDPSIESGSADADTNNGTATDPTLLFAPITDASVPGSTNTSGDPANSDTNANTSTQTQSAGDAKTPDLMSLLLQLEQMARAQAAQTLQAANTDPANANANTQNTAANNTKQTTPGTGDPFTKIDLRALMAAINNLNNTTDATDGPTGDTTGDAQNQQTAAVAASLQDLVAAPSTAKSSSTQNQTVISPDLLSLFNANFADQNKLMPSAAFAIGGNAAFALGTNGETSLDTGMQDQGGANARNAADLSNSNTNLSPLAANATQSASPYDFASQLSALRSSKGGSAGLPTPIEQVVLQLSKGLNKDGESQMTIQLRPAELGRVDVKLNVDRDGKVHGTVTADSPATLGLLLKDVGGLERALQEAGLRADPGSLQFNLRGDGQPGSNSNQTADQSNTNNFDDSAGTIMPVSGETAETYYLTPGGVNLRV